MIGTFVWISAFVYSFLAIAWSKNNLLDLIFKFAFFVLTAFCIVILYKENGFSGLPFK